MQVIMEIKLEMEGKMEVSCSVWICISVLVKKKEKRKHSRNTMRCMGCRSSGLSPWGSSYRRISLPSVVGRSLPAHAQPRPAPPAGCPGRLGFPPPSAPPASLSRCLPKPGETMETGCQAGAQLLHILLTTGPTDPSSLNQPGKLWR